MKRSSTGIIWGLVVLVIGVLIGAKAFGADFDIFFEGWWTLFIIVPSAVGLTEKGSRTGSLIALSIGVLLLLASRDVIEWNMFGKLILAAVFVIVGIKIIIDETCRHKGMDSSNTSSFSSNKTVYYTNSSDEQSYTGGAEQGANYQSTGSNYSNEIPRTVTAIFSGKDINFNGKEFFGMALSAVFGGIDLDLRNAIITKDVIIDVTAIFGGIDIKVSDNVRIVTNCTPIFGGVDDHSHFRGGSDGNSVHTIYLNGACIFGGVDIK